jgi:hypothetical protein
MNTQPEPKGMAQNIYLARFKPADINSEETRLDRLRGAERLNSSIRSEIEQWILNNNLGDHLKILPVGRVFNLLFIEADSLGSKFLSKAPHLIDIAPSDDVDVELLASPLSG